MKIILKNSNKSITLKKNTNNIVLSQTGRRGPQGLPGADGQPGPQGMPGVGVPPGGTTGQILVKLSNDDYDTAWVDAPTPPEPPQDIDGGDSGTAAWDSIIDGGDASTTEFNNEISGGDANGN